MSATFRAVVERALVEALRKEENPKKLASALALQLREQFRSNGFSIHARGACVRLHGQDAAHIGREMTPEEMATLGVDRVG